MHIENLKPQTRTTKWALCGKENEIDRLCGKENEIAIHAGCWRGFFRSTCWLAGGGFSLCMMVCSKLGTAIEARMEVGEAHSEQKQRVEFHRVLSQHNTLHPRDFLDQGSLSVC